MGCLDTHANADVSHAVWARSKTCGCCEGAAERVSCVSPAEMPADGPLFPVPKQKRYLTWEPDLGGLNNIRMQVHLPA